MKKWKNGLIFTVALLAVPVATRIVAAQPKLHYTPSGIMEPTIKFDTFIKVKSHPFESINQVQRGDIVLYSHKDANPQRLITTTQRVVALPGDKVSSSGTRLQINGRTFPHVLLKRVGKVAIYQEANGQATYKVQYGDNTFSPPNFSVTVPKGHVFCLGDNRDNANDSRYVGAMPFGSIVGQPVP